MINEEDLAERIKYKSRASWVVGFAWMILSGVLFYLLWPSISIVAVSVLFALIAVVIYVSVGFVLRAPTILFRNVLVYPFSIPIAQVLNFISQRWSYTQETGPIAFGVQNMFLFFFVYMIVSPVSLVLLKFFSGAEAYSVNPIVARTYFAQSDQGDIVKILSGFVGILKDFSPKIFKEEKAIWIKFYSSESQYALTVTPRERPREFEINLLLCSLRNDIVCEPYHKEAAILDSLLNAYVSTRKGQGDMDDWKIENAPKYSDEVRTRFFKALTTASEMRLKRFSYQQARQNTYAWLKTHKKGVLIYIFSAIIIPLLVNYLLKLF